MATSHILKSLGPAGERGFQGFQGTNGTIGVNGTQGPQGPTLDVNNNTDNYILTATGGTSVNGESGLTWDGSAMTITGNIVPSADVTYDLGTATKKWRDLYLSGNTVYLGDTKLQRDNDGNLEVKDRQTDARKTLIVDAIEMYDGNSKFTMRPNAAKGRIETVGLNNSVETIDITSLERASSQISNSVDSLETALTAEISATNSDVTRLDGNVTSINTRATGIESDLTSLETALSGDIATESGRIDAILSGANANTDTFAEVVSLINTVDTTNDQAFSGYATNTNASVDSLEGRVSIADGSIDSLEALFSTDSAARQTQVENQDLTNVSFSTATGVLQIDKYDGTCVTTSLDGRYCTTDTNTTYSAGTGLTLSGTTFSIQNDLRGEMCLMGYSTSDYIYVQNTVIDFRLDGNLDMRLENDGDLHVDGDVIAYSTTTSDKRFKDNITPITGALDKVLSMRGVEFDWNAGNRKGEHDLGVIAQEIEQVLPEIVREKKLPMFDDSDTIYKTVDYEKIIPVLIESIKELKAEIELLKG